MFVCLLRSISRILSAVSCVCVHATSIVWCANNGAAQRIKWPSDSGRRARARLMTTPYQHNIYLSLARAINIPVAMVNRDWVSRYAANNKMSCDGRCPPPLLHVYFMKLYTPRAPIVSWRQRWLIIIHIWIAIDAISSRRSEFIDGILFHMKTKKNISIHKTRCILFLTERRE